MRRVQACYLIYKQFEPNHPSIHAVLLLGMPVLLARQLPVLQQIGAVASHWGLILALTALYRRSPFHPLAKFPGPTLGKLSKIYVAYLTARGDLYRVIESWHEQYGDVIRIGSCMFGWGLIQLWSSFCLAAGPNELTFYYDTRLNPEGDFQLDGIRDFSVHAARRKPWARAMSSAALKGYEPILQMKTLELMEELSKRHREKIDISHWTNLFSFDVLGHVAFDRELGLVKSGEDSDGLIHIVEGGVYAGALISHVLWMVPFFKYIPAKGLRAVQLLAASYVQERTSKGSKSKDLSRFFTEDEGAAQSGATMGEITADGMLAIIAGSDTTSTMLTNLWYFMLRHPEYAERLRKEIDLTFPPGEDPLDFSRHADMPYLNACINETLRVLPPAPGGLQRTVKRGSGGATICSYFVPECTQVSVPIFSVHRDSREFSPLPDDFWPDRWLTQDSYVLPNGDVIGKEQVITNRGAFIPFSFGPQNCAGRALAMVEMRAVACVMMHKFELRKPKEYDLNQWEKDMWDALIMLRGKLPVILEQRQGH
ncbi:uncharacterized protein PHACADRAFT_148937 [Phanerochaete carnosa HHB-10118-sp]|uniref:Cytochrome P450 n=1 Tax=Phanerochaete carnosa (strain HHB-10118-sp) TaxID=650164 RepID=K5UR80_PHACS|nr:uncharacterized protein PHACADRAFT_148937 [Phanerochaete carnosa HHB-10118-sp]EKM52361.1 hypothetical protein PHACADRAFT_148937 [Phanerochaete carnosa HHB-10118-sp]